MRKASLIATAALAAALMAATFLAIADTYSGQDCEVTSEGTVECRDTSRTLAETNGDWVYSLLVIPVALTGGGLAAIARGLSRRLVWLLAWLLLAGCIVAIFSFGAFFLPAAALLLAAAFSDKREAAET